MKKNNKGFTLIELLAVVIILGIVVTISVQTYGNIILKNDEDKYKYYLDFIKKGVDLYTDAKKVSMLDKECLLVDYQTLVDKNYLKEEGITCTGNIILKKEDNKYIYDDTNLECSTKKGKIVKEKGETEAICNVTLQFTFDNNYERVSNIAKDMNALTDNWKDLNTTHTVISSYDLKDAKQMSFTENLSESGIYQELTEPIIYGKIYTWTIYIKANNTHRFKIGLGSGTKEIQATGDWQKVTHTFEAEKEDTEVKEFKIVSTTGWQGTNDDLYLHSTEFLKVSKPLKTKYAKVIGKTFESLPQVTRKGYELVGWFTEPNGGEQITESTIVPNKKNITYYAHWKKKDLKVNYLANGGVGTTTTDTITYGDNYTIKDNTFTKEKYKFINWQELEKSENFDIWPSTLIAWDFNDDVNLSAIWKINNFKVTIAKGEGIATVTGAGDYTPGTEVTISADLASNSAWINWTGYQTSTSKSFTFTMPEEDVNFTANGHQHKGTSGLTYANGCYTQRQTNGGSCGGHPWKTVQWHCGACGTKISGNGAACSNRVCSHYGSGGSGDWAETIASGTKYCSSASGCSNWRWNYIYVLGCGYN